MTTTTATTTAAAAAAAAAATQVDPSNDPGPTPLISRRVLLNLAVFVLIGLLLAAWAATNVLSLSAITHPYDINADFASSPGLQTNFQVAFLGVKVGQISSVSLSPGEAVVKMKINHGVKLPVGLTASASRQSAIGEPYVALSPPAGYTNGGPYLKPGYTIGLGQTSVPLSYEDLFASLDRLASAVQPAALNSLLHELALALNGRADTIRQLIGNTTDLTSTLATNATQVDDLITDLTNLTQTLASHSGAIGSSIDNLALVSQSLAQSKTSIDEILATAPSFAASVNDILAKSDGNLGCLIDGLGVVTKELSGPEQIQALEHQLAIAPTLAALIPAITATTPTGIMLKGSAHFNVANAPPVPFYPTPHTLPPVPKVPGCPGATPAATPGASAAAGAAGSAGGAIGPHSVTTAPTPVSAVAVPTSSTLKVHSRSVGFLLWVAAAVIALALVAAVARRLLRSPAE